MITIKVKFRNSSVPGRPGRIYYQLTRNRFSRQLNTPYLLYPAEWDKKHGSVLIPMEDKRRKEVLEIGMIIRHDLERLAHIVRKYNDKRVPYEVSEVMDEFHRYEKEYTLFNFMYGLIEKFNNNGKIRTSETYSSALRSFSKFRQGKDLSLDRIYPELMEDYESWLRKRGLTPNTTSFYARILRAVYNRAVNDGITENRSPFRHVYTGVDKTTKRALPLPLIKRIRQLDLTDHPKLDYARDIFILSFMLRGMSFVDMAFLRKKDLRDGHIMYRRRKTGQQLMIKWTREMQQILDKYPENSTDYLLPIIRKRGINERYAYLNAGYTINRSLKSIASKAGIKIALTLYVARHSWASAAKSKGIPLSVISEGMGHESETTTRIYLASLDTTVVDRANSIILKSI